ncbi:hypothetical protein COY52_10780 [Candidatus Desantisbacteria bacterium CG_4_10_14_0_8_um_filter_48_22]|uniref:Major facilitator superfamily (MFS) profile domain-containing protein n=1 Tax=Candidatus Desantisbacteria bacterium CG_4_10_14_0_8_um_filter_48_22 TaxID=1974543 RepID=A0A2M7S5S3_9BACT|nr:MAG: hypothetical protein COY52_10780 [Candidatus Desantisbacteria bacterium CG_4_10_14_0_8_um_filter_48_22]
MAISASNGLSILSAFIAGKYLDRLGFPSGYAACFFSAFLAQGLSLVFLGCNIERENKHAVEEKHSFGDYLVILKGILKNDRYFLRFLTVQIILCLSGIAGPFFGVYADYKLHLTGSMLGGLTMMLVAGQAVATIILGMLGDYWGHRTSLAISVFSAAAAAVLAVFSNSFPMFSIVFFLLGIGGAPAFVSIINMLLEMNETGDRGSYIALNTTFTAPFAAAAPLIGGLLIKNVSYTFVFMLAAGILVAGFILLLCGAPKQS